MLKLTGISHSFGDNRVLCGVSLTLFPGQRLAVMAPSGQGKTTLLRIILGLLRPDVGSVENTFRKTGVVFQEPRLLPWRTAAENVNLVLGDRKETLPRARELLQRLGLGEAGDKYPRELSGGMQQRTALARALAVDADLLILDEPFKALDETLRRQALEEVGKSQAAILLVTHDETEAKLLNCEIMNL